MKAVGFVPRKLLMDGGSGCSWDTYELVLVCNTKRFEPQ